MTETAKAILAYVTDEPGSTRRDLESETGLSWDDVRDAVAELAALYRITISEKGAIRIATPPVLSRRPFPAKARKALDGFPNRFRVAAAMEGRDWFTPVDAQREIGATNAAVNVALYDMMRRNVVERMPRDAGRPGFGKWQYRLIPAKENANG